ncbi:MAG: hypothetical protein ABIG90_01900 [bacterium]
MEDRSQKILLLIRERFLMFLYESLFKTNQFLVLKTESGKDMRRMLKANKFNLIVLGMMLDKKDLEFLVDNALSEKVPVLFLNIDTTKDFLEAYLKYDQYVYIDILTDDPKTILKKAKNLMIKYKAG